MSNIMNAKLIIDDIAKTGENYVIHNNRKCRNFMIPLQCLPCITYSTVARIISCPFQCLLNRHTQCNPITSLFTDSTLTMTSDRCIFSKWKKNNEKQYIHAKGLTRVELEELVVYTSEKIKEATIIKTKYALADALSYVTCELYIEVNPTPEYIITTALEITQKVDQ